MWYREGEVRFKVPEGSTERRDKIENLINSGWMAAPTHFHGSGVKADAPFLSFLSAVKESARKALPSERSL